MADVTLAMADVTLAVADVTLTVVAIGRLIKNVATSVNDDKD
jgi:hypothetical protein